MILKIKIVLLSWAPCKIQISSIREIVDSTLMFKFLLVLNAKLETPQLGGNTPLPIVSR